MTELAATCATPGSERGTSSHGTESDVGRRSGCAQPPSRHDIDVFMVTYSAHLPHPGFDAEAATETSSTLCPSPSAAHRLLAPYLYTGADYALVLAACFPTRCIDLAQLNWSSSPLLSQRQGNLRVFCDAAKRLALPDAPLSALHPELLQSNPTCVVAHLKVQHWLYSLSLRFAPRADHDSATLRAVHRHLQLGEPFLKRRRTESTQQQQQQQQQEHGVCPSVQECAALSATDLERCCGPVLAPLPPFTETPSATASATSSSSLNAQGGIQENANGASLAEGASHHAKQAEEGSRSAGQKPWLNYSKPWLLPSLRAAEAKKAAAEAATARRAREERERNPRYTAFASQSKNVQQQSALSAAALAEKRERLRAVKAFLIQEMIEGRAFDFKEIGERLGEQC